MRPGAPSPSIPSKLFRAPEPRCSSTRIRVTSSGPVPKSTAYCYCLVARPFLTQCDPAVVLTCLHVYRSPVGFALWIRRFLLCASHLRRVATEVFVRSLIQSIITLSSARSISCERLSRVVLSVVFAPRQRIRKCRM